MRATEWMTCAAIVLALGCGGSSVSPDAAVRRDDAGAAPGLPLPLPSALPIGPGDVIRVGPGLLLDEGRALGVAADGVVTYAFESYGAGRASCELWVGSSGDGRHVELPRPSGFSEHVFEASPSFVDGALYFAGADDATQPPTLYRAVVAAPVALPSVAGLASLASHPRLRSIPGGVALAFTDGSGRAMLATGADPSSLGAPIAVSDAGSLPSVGVFGDGTLAYAYHDATNAFVRSGDGASFADPLAVSDAPGAHDAALVERADGGLDVYFVRGALYRRSLRSDGRLGAEERVTADEVGEPRQPSGVMLADGRALIAFALIEAADQTLALASLPSASAAP